MDRGSAMGRDVGMTRDAIALQPGAAFVIVAGMAADASTTTP